VLALAAGALAEHGLGLIASLSGSGAGPVVQASASQHICPMHPEIVRDGPDSCPICGMDLVAVEARVLDGSGGGQYPVVWIEPEVEHNLGVRTARAAKRTLQKQVDTVGYVEYDRSKLRDVYSPANGNVHDLTIYSEGERVKKGQLLFNLDSPMLSSYYDNTFADRDGIVAFLNVIEGEFVTSTTKILTIADLSSVWLLADVFERQAHWVERGQKATVRLPYIPDRTWDGMVEYLYPNLDPETRTLKVRMRFDNPGEILKPNMHAEVTIFGDEKPEALAIPRETLIETGNQQRVIVAQGSGHYQPRQVTVGMEAEGDEVVISGQFLLDSESNLKASLARLASDR
jgi:Cu(I)/Ag(I) efflux system membrane fusion protein